MKIEDGQLYCYLRAADLKRVLAKPANLDMLMAKLRVEGKPAHLKAMSVSPTTGA